MVSRALLVAAAWTVVGCSGDSGGNVAPPASGPVVGAPLQTPASCPGADLSGLSSFVYVSTQGTDGPGCGKTTAAACRTLQQGIDHCSATGCGVLVRHGLYQTTATVGLRDAVSVYGGCRFDGEPDRKYRTVIEARPAPGTAALRGVSINTATTVHGLVVIGADETANGTASIAMAVSSSKGLALSQMVLSGGKGGDGAQGGTPAATPGNAGGDAALSLGTNTWRGTGGAGAPACIAQGRSAAAGAGGDGANFNQIRSYGCFFQCGCDNIGGTGGGRGALGGNGEIGGGGGGVGANGPICSPGGTPTDGGTGGTGAPGACSRTPGVPDANIWGGVVEAAWHPGRGGDGDPGGWGAGGGGGGAGSACTHTNGTAADYFGFPGGGGGSGGCGGPGGTGGQQGGASVGLLLLDSSVSADSRHYTIIPGPGGQGGPGGHGSAGGAGGRGGRDGKAVYYPNITACTVGVGGGDEGGLGYAGGSGGFGGAGGAGSGGAGGNGGPSIAVALIAKATAPASTDGLFLGRPGPGGAAGPGGIGPGCSAAVGAPGVGGGAGLAVDLDAAPSNILAEGQVLAQGAARTSANGTHRLVLQTDGNFCLYSAGAYRWCSMQAGLGSAATVAMQTDGNLCLRRADGSASWCSQTAGHPGAYLTVRDDGNVAIYDGSISLATLP